MKINLIRYKAASIMCHRQIATAFKNIIIITIMNLGLRHLVVLLLAVIYSYISVE